MKMNVSEPLMTCRNWLDDVERRDGTLSADELRRWPAYGLSGIRHKEGMSLVVGVQVEPGNLSLRCKGKRSSGKHHKTASTDAEHRGGRPRSSGEGGETHQSKGGLLFSKACEPTRKRRSS
jgi:hypothetical protein